MASAAEQLAANLNFSAFAKAEELKKRIWFTLGALLVYRFGTYVPLPGINPEAFVTRQRFPAQLEQNTVIARRALFVRRHVLFSTTHKKAPPMNTRHHLAVLPASTGLYAVLIAHRSMA